MLLMINNDRKKHNPVKPPNITGNKTKVCCWIFQTCNHTFVSQQKLTKCTQYVIIIHIFCLVMSILTNLRIKTCLRINFNKNMLY